MTLPGMTRVNFSMSHLAALAAASIVVVVYATRTIVDPGNLSDSPLWKHVSVPLRRAIGLGAFVYLAPVMGRVALLLATGRAAVRLTEDYLTVRIGALRFRKKTFPASSVKYIRRNPRSDGVTIAFHSGPPLHIGPRGLKEEHVDRLPADY